MREFLHIVKIIVCMIILRAEKLVAVRKRILDLKKKENFIKNCLTFAGILSKYVE